MRKDRMLLVAAAAAASVASAAAAGQQPVAVDANSAVNACLTAEEQARPLEQLSLSERHAMIACISAHAARQLQSSLPLRVDELTTLTALTTDGPRVIYNYRISREAAALPRDAAARFESATRAAVCSNPQMRETVALGGSYEYRWNDSAGRRIHRMVVTSC